MFPCNADAKSRYILRCSLPGAVHLLRPAVDMASLTPTVIIVGIFFCGLIYSVLSLRTRRPPLPPGPKIWLFGSDKLPKSRPWLTYADWRQKFGLSCLLILTCQFYMNTSMDRRHYLYWHIWQSYSCFKFIGGCLRASCQKKQHLLLEAG